MSESEEPLLSAEELVPSRTWSPMGSLAARPLAITRKPSYFDC